MPETRIYEVIGIDVYLEWLELRIQQLHRILKPTGPLYLHCDQAARHYLKVALDKPFGRRRFRNEIVGGRTPFTQDCRDAGIRISVGCGVDEPKSRTRSGPATKPGCAGCP